MPLDFARPLSAEELRRKLDAAGYDLQQLDALGATLKLDLIGVLAGWAPVLARIYSDLQPAVPRLPWYRRLAKWIERNWYV